jgi:hypothetical protein
MAEKMMKASDVGCGDLSISCAPTIWKKFPMAMSFRSRKNAIP